jgi:hypothetical protein
VIKREIVYSGGRSEISTEYRTSEAGTVAVTIAATRVAVVVMQEASRTSRNRESSTLSKLSNQMTC